MAPADLQLAPPTADAVPDLEAVLRLVPQARAGQAVVRPATVGDGIEVLDKHGQLACIELAAEAAQQGRVSAFVPASGAATRMFEEELAALADASAPELAERIRGLAMSQQIQPAASTDDRALLVQVADQLASLPKALVAFHRGPDGLLTPLHEHLAEAVALGRDAEGVVRLHVTAPPDFRERYRQVLAQATSTHPGVSLQATVSVQEPWTDTPVLDDALQPVRDREGRILTRPGGHGALLHNLQATGGDLVVVKNVDNVVNATFRRSVLSWRKVVLGRLVQLQGEAHRLVRALRAGEPVLEQARAFAERVLGVRLDGDVEALAARLDRPWRVAAMVRASGHVGGGPMWVQLDDGESVQIVEQAQLDLSDPAVARMMADATHFHPVDMALGLRAADGSLHELGRFTDPAAGMLTKKLVRGRMCTVYEHPGLWNGAMARWNTVFVDVPSWTFAPVKRVGDLLGRAHRSAVVV